MGAHNWMKKAVIFFDGVCNLCNSSVQLIIKKDKKGAFLFASLQSEFAKNNLPASLNNEGDFKSIVLLDGDQLRIKSSAALTIAKTLSGLWPLLYVFIIIPKFIRDFVYDIIARNRYNWFGKKDQCMIPSKQLQSRFLD